MYSLPICPPNKLIVFNIPKRTLIGIKNNEDFYLLGDAIFNKFTKEILNNYIISNQILRIEKSIKQIVVINGIKILYLKGNFASVETFDFAIVGKDAVKIGPQLIEQVRAKKWIIDSSVDAKNRFKWQNILKGKNISFISLDPTTFAYIQNLP